MTSIRGAALAALLSLCWAGTAAAQIPYTPAVPSTGVNDAFPAQNALGPTGPAMQVNYPYPGQCLADPANQNLFPTTLPCANLGSFAAPSQRTAGGWADAGRLIAPAALNPVLPNSAPPIGTPATPKFAFNVLNPIDYTPDTTTYPGADYYEIGVHEAWGFDPLAKAGLFPNPGVTVPNGMQWTGLVCNALTGCTCPADASPSFRTTYCNGTGLAAGNIPHGRAALHADLGCRPDQHGRRPGHRGPHRRRPVHPRSGERVVRRTASSPPGRRSASAPPAAARSS